MTLSPEYRTSPHPEYLWFAEDLESCELLYYRTLPDALAGAQNLIESYRGEDGTAIEEDSIVVGHITHIVEECDHVYRPGELDAQGHDAEGNHWPIGLEYRCHYRMLPVRSDLPGAAL